MTKDILTDIQMGSFYLADSVLNRSGKAPVLRGQLVETVKNAGEHASRDEIDSTMKKGSADAYRANGRRKS